ncbi:MAG: LytTR family transcriptional regulator [Flavobacteriaceae bacterium]|nr:LytTR family transcriptional regulator [Flavobacteriaceae bacterium]
MNFNEELNLSTFIFFFKYNLTLLFPTLVFIVLLDYVFILKSENENIKIINKEISIDSKSDLIEYRESTYFFKSDNKSEEFEWLKRDILFIKGADNYIEICYLGLNNKIQKNLIRSQIKRVEQDEKNDFLIKVHRSYLCNLKNVEKVSGNSNGYLLHFKNTFEKIPVSRNYSYNIVNLRRTTFQF